MRWPHFDHIFFDCDSTLSEIEGIDILAENAGKKQAVEALTKAAMEGQLGLEDVYAKRLAAIKPTQKDIRDIKRAYKNTIVAHAQDVINALKYLGQNVYIISGGLYEPVAEFGVSLGVKREHIRAVKVEYDLLSGNWWENDHTPVSYMNYNESPLTISDGKAEIVKELLGDQGGRSLLIGDGSSDLLASRAVDLFVGFGGIDLRKPIVEGSPVYLTCPTLAPLLALACGPALMATLDDTKFSSVCETAHEEINNGALRFNDEQLKKKFNRAYQAVYSGAR